MMCEMTQTWESTDVLVIVRTVVHIAFAQVHVHICREPCVFKINFNSRLMLS